MSSNLGHLFKTKRFLPLFTTQFLGALNDNLFKNALTILVLYKLADLAGQNGQILVTIAAGIFILPFFLFSAFLPLVKIVVKLKFDLMCFQTCTQTFVKIAR